MGDPVGTHLEVGAAILSGRQQRNAYKMEAMQMETEKKAIEANAAMAQEERTRKLQTVLAAQNAMFAMTGQTIGAGSARTIQAASMSEANREQKIEQLQTDLAKSTLDYNIKSAKQASKRAMQTSLTNFAIDFGSRNYATGMKFVGNMLKKYFSGGMMGGGMGG